MFLITLVWSAGVAFKPNSMGGRESWGPVNFKISMLWWISILFVFLTKVSPFLFFHNGSVIRTNSFCDIGKSRS